MTRVLRLGFFILGVQFVTAQAPQNYIYTSSGDLHGIEKMITREDIGGVQIVYNWKALEKTKDVYDFSAIEKDLDYLTNSIENYLSSFRTDSLNHRQDIFLIMF